jgi:hypothetical protein
MIELSRQDDELFEWAKKRPQLFAPLDTDVQLIQANIVNRPRFQKFLG